MVREREVFLSRCFILPDGTVHDTWFVIVVGATLQEPGLCIKSTTQPARYLPVVQGCNQKSPINSCFFIEQAYQRCFSEDSYLVLPEIHEISLAKILELREQQRFVFKGKLTVTCYLDLLWCLQQFTYDIAEDHFYRLEEIYLEYYSEERFTDEI